MKKRLNIKAVGILLGAFALFLVGVHFLHAYQVKRNAGAFLTLADGALAEGQKQKAVDYLARYLRLEPSDTDTRAKFGLLLADEEVMISPKALLRAYFVLGQVLLRDPTRNDVRRRVVEVAMHDWLQRFGDASEHLKKLLAAAPDDGELLGMQARCREVNGEYREARKNYEAAIARSPAELENYFRLAILLRNHVDEVKAKGEDKQALAALADKHIDNMVAANANNFKVHLRRAYYRKEWHADNPDRLKAFEQDVQEALRLAPEKVDVILAAAELAQLKKTPQVARKLLRDGMAAPQHAKEWRLVQALSRLEVLDNKPEAALACLRDGLKTMPDDFNLLWNYAHLVIHMRQDTETDDVIAKLKELRMPQAQLQYLDARKSFNREEWLKAARALERIYPLFIKGHDQRKDWFSFNLGLECNLLLGGCYEQMGDPDRAASAYNRVVARDPRSAAGRRGLARMKWALGQFGDAEREYQRLFLLPDVPAAAWIEISQLLIARNLRSQQSNWKQVKQLLKQIKELPDEHRPAATTLALLDAEVSAAQSDYDEARRRLEEVKDNKQMRPAEIWIGLANLELKRNKTDAGLDAALAELDKATKELGDHIDLRLARVRYWARRGGAEAAKEFVRLGQNLDRFPRADQLRLLRALADAHGQTGDLKEATRLWAEFAQKRPSDIGSRLTLFDLALMTEDQEALPERINDIRKLEGDDGVLWFYCRASLRIREAQNNNKAGLQEAAQLLKTVTDRRPGWGRAVVAQALVADLQNKPEAFVAKCKQAVVLGERRPTVLLHLVQRLASRGELDAVDEIMRRLREEAPSLIDGLERPAAEVALSRGNIEKALQLARKHAPDNSKDYRVHVWLGRILGASGMPAEAEASLRRALALNDGVPEPWVALVQHLVRTGGKEQATLVVRQAEEKLPKGKAVRELAHCYELIGKTERARELYTAALTARPDDPAILFDMALFCLRSKLVEEAKNHLNKIIERKTNPTADLARARVALALLTASGGGYQNLQKAQAMLGAADDESGQSVTERRARVVFLASEPSARKRREAIAILEPIVRTQAGTAADDKFLLAQLYDSVGDWPKTKSYMNGLLAAVEEKLAQGATVKEQEKKSLQAVFGNYLNFYALRLIRRGEVREAEIWQAKFERLEPETFRSLGVKARLLHKKGQGEKAVPFLKKLVAGQEKLVRPVAALLEQIGQTAAAQEMFERYVTQTKQPEAALVLASFFGRQDRPSEALALCERAWKTCAPDAVSGVCVAVLYEAKSGKPHAARVATWLEQTIEKHPDKSELLNDLAAVRRLQGREQDAVELLRKIATRDKSDALSLNNLAWLLALGGKSDESLEILKQAIALRGELASLLDTRAVAYLLKGQHALAVTDMENAIADSPTNHRYFHLAQAHLGAGNPGAARVALERAKELGLTESSVDPLERTAYRQLRAKLDRP